MEKLIKIQTLVNQIEDLTLEMQYHSTFNYLNDKKMQIKTFCWDQARTYKDLLDNIKDVNIYMEGNSTIEIWEF